MELDDLTLHINYFLVLFCFVLFVCLFVCFGGFFYWPVEREAIRKLSKYFY